MMARIVWMLACAAVLAGCTVDQHYSQTELSALQTREFAASYDRTFDAAVNALFDGGYRVHSSDKRGGFLSAMRTRGNAWSGYVSQSVQLKIEGAGGGRTSVRVSTTDGGGQQHVDKEQIDELFDLMDRRLLAADAPTGAKP